MSKKLLEQQATLVQITSENGLNNLISRGFKFETLNNDFTRLDTFPMIVVGCTKQGALMVTKHLLLAGAFDKSRYNRLRYELGKHDNFESDNGVKLISRRLTLQAEQINTPVVKAVPDSPFALANGVQDWHHFILIGDNAIQYIWDTREVTGIFTINEGNARDFISVPDNNAPLVTNDDAKVNKLLTDRTPSSLTKTERGLMV